MTTVKPFVHLRGCGCYSGVESTRNAVLDVIVFDQKCLNYSQVVQEIAARRGRQILDDWMKLGEELWLEKYPCSDEDIANLRDHIRRYLDQHP